MGLYESRIEDLTRHAGIAKGTLYGYFANKNELIEAVVSSGTSELLGHAHREAQGARSHAEVVERIARSHLTFYEENPDLLRIFHQVRGLLKFNRPEVGRLRRVLSNYLAGLARLLTMEHPRGGRGEDIEAAVVLFGAVSGVASTRAAMAGMVPSRPRSRETVRALVALVLAFESLPGKDARSMGEDAERAQRRTTRRPRAAIPTAGRKARGVRARRLS
jgi:AcrR family transcriptional regulator